MSSAYGAFVHRIDPCIDMLCILCVFHFVYLGDKLIFYVITGVAMYFGCVYLQNIFVKILCHTILLSSLYGTYYDIYVC